MTTATLQLTVTDAAGRRSVSVSEQPVLDRPELREPAAADRCAGVAAARRARRVGWRVADSRLRVALRDLRQRYAGGRNRDQPRRPDSHRADGTAPRERRPHVDQLRELRFPAGERPACRAARARVRQGARRSARDRARQCARGDGRRARVHHPRRCRRQARAAPRPRQGRRDARHGSDQPAHSR